MATVKLFDSEMKIMEIIWEFEPISAKQISELAAQKIGWHKNTTYTVISKLIQKNALLRADPGYICTSLIKQDDVKNAVTASLINKFYGGSKKALFASFLDENEFTPAELDDLAVMIQRRKNIEAK